MSLNRSYFRDVSIIALDLDWFTTFVPVSLLQSVDVSDPYKIEKAFKKVNKKWLKKLPKVEPPYIEEHKLQDYDIWHLRIREIYHWHDKGRLGLISRIPAVLAHLEGKRCTKPYRNSVLKAYITDLLK